MLRKHIIYVHFLFLTVLTILVLFATREATAGLHVINHIYTLIFNSFAKVLADGAVGLLIHKTLAIMITATLFALIPALIYWIIKRKSWVYFPFLLWICWLIVTMSVLFK